MYSRFIISALTLCGYLVNGAAVDNYPNTCDSIATGTLQKWTPNSFPVEQFPNDLVKMTGKDDYGACQVYYRKTSHVACMKSGWSTESSIPGNGCKRWIRVENTVNGAKTDAQILDVCPGDVPTFGCEDLFLSERAFDEVAGSSETASEAAGHLTDKIKWHLQSAPCWTCYAGLGSQLPDGRVDDCTGKDGDGFMRCGTKVGKDVITGKDVEKVCNKNYQCPE